MTSTITIRKSNEIIHFLPLSLMLLPSSSMDTGDTLNKDGVFQHYPDLGSECEVPSWIGAATFSPPSLFFGHCSLFHSRRKRKSFVCPRSLMVVQRWGKNSVQSGVKDGHHSCAQVHLL